MPTAKILGKLIWNDVLLTIRLHTKHFNGHRQQDYICEMKVTARDVRLDGKRIPFYFSLKGEKRLTFTHLGACCFVESPELSRALKEDFTVGYVLKTDATFKGVVSNGIDQYD